MKGGGKWTEREKGREKEGGREGEVERGVGGK